jgi:predicted protein tyrosine phosphatase
VKSAGVDERAKTVLTTDLLDWADLVFVFERRQRNIIRKQFKEHYAKKSIICLYIPDIYEYKDVELIEILRERLQRYIGSPGNDSE